VSDLAAETKYFFRMRYADDPPAFSNLSNEANCTTSEWPSDIIYNLVGVNNSSAEAACYEGAVGHWTTKPEGPNLVFKNPMNDSQYEQVESSDDSRLITTSPGGSNDPMIWCEFDIYENVSDIVRMDFLFEGYNEGGTVDHQVWVWKHYGADPGWEKLGPYEVVPGGNDTTFERSLITDNFSEYLWDGVRLYWVVMADGNGNRMVVDYVEARMVIQERDISPPASVYLTAVGERECVYLKWTAPGDDDIIGIASSYDMRYSTSGEINEGNWGNATEATGEPSPGEPGTLQDMFVYNLSSSNTYYFALKTADEVPNWASIFNSPSAKPASNDVTPPSAVTDLSCGNITGRSIELNLTAVADDYRRWWTGPAYYYDIRHSTSGPVNSSNWNSATQYVGEPRPGAPGRTDVFTLTGFSPQTTYWFALKVGDEVINWSGISNSASATTDEPWPQTITDLSVAAEWDRVRLSWTAPYEDYNNSGSGNCTEYDIRYSYVPITNTTWSQAVQCTDEPVPGTPGSTDAFVISGLEEGETYYFAIKAKDAVADNWNDLSNSPSITVQQPDHEVGDWWMWYAWYDDLGTQSVQNKGYIIQNVFAVNETVQVRVNNSSSYFNVTGCTRMNWNVDDRKTEDGGWGGVRTEFTNRLDVTSAKGRMYDAEMWTGARDATVRIRLDSIFEYYGLPYGLPDEDVAIETCYTYQGNGSAPAADDGYPLSINDVMDQYEYKEVDYGLIDPIYSDYDWEVVSFFENYNVSAETNISACDHDGNYSNGIYDVYKLDVAKAGAGKSGYWYSPEVHNVVRKLDTTTYYGMEEWGIVAYEVADFTKEGLTVSADNDPPNEGDTLTVSINVTNDTGEEQKFNMLLLIMDLNASTPTDGEPYYNGKTVYPNMSADPNSTWPHYDAIKQTSLLQPGDSETVTWNSCYTIPYNNPNHWYEVWCSGETYGPWEAD